MFARSVFNDIKNTIIVNNSRSRQEKCILFTKVWIGVWKKNEKGSLPLVLLGLSPKSDLCITLV